jgi:site-specific DNA-methyltransferase (adenine-specific)/adenine-specific DNA-methyltransferase
LGGDFQFCKLSDKSLFTAEGQIQAEVSFADLARHVYFTETGEPLPHDSAPNTLLIGVHRGIGIYLLYNGILRDQSEDGGNVLTRAVLAKLPPFNGPKIIYCAGCLLGRDRLQAERILHIRQSPYEIKAS